VAVFDPAVFNSGVFDTGGGGDLVANISMTMTVVGSLQLSAEMVANIPMTMTAVGGLTALIAMAADIPMMMTLDANLRVARNVGRLKTCGDPLSTMCQDWLLK
jgi:hypothetical protein